jgi:selenocysteine lyase/cysteine desulfurase
MVAPSTKIQSLSTIRFRSYELSNSLLEVLEEIPGVSIYGMAKWCSLERRVPVEHFNLAGWHQR